MTDRLVTAETLAAALHNLGPAPSDGYGYGYIGQPGRNLAIAILAAIPPDPRLDALLAALDEAPRISEGLLDALAATQAQLDARTADLDALEVQLTANDTWMREAEASEARLRAALPVLYRKYPAAIADLCDEWLDRSGGLLGHVRDDAIFTVPHDPPDARVT